MTEQQQFIDSVVPGAQLAAVQYHVPASVSIAQAILESAWGKSGLAKRAKNLFGIKADLAWMGSVRVMPTEEFYKGKRVTVRARFRAYKTFAESISDHARFLRGNERYHDAFLTSAWRLFATRIAKDGYATDPEYADKLISLIQKYQLDRYDLPNGEVGSK